MSEINGKYDLVLKSPMGDQSVALTVQADGDTFTGTTSGAMGVSDIAGEVAGNAITWKQSVTSPMPLTLTFQATITGSTIEGKVDTGSFGAFPLTGKKAA